MRGNVSGDVVEILEAWQKSCIWRYEALWFSIGDLTLSLLHRASGCGGPGRRTSTIQPIAKWSVPSLAICSELFISTTWDLLLTAATRANGLAF